MVIKWYLRCITRLKMIGLSTILHQRQGGTANIQETKTVDTFQLQSPPKGITH